MRNSRRWKNKNLYKQGIALIVAMALIFTVLAPPLAQARQRNLSAFYPDTSISIHHLRKASIWMNPPSAIEAEKRVVAEIESGENITSSSEFTVPSHFTVGALHWGLLIHHVSHVLHDPHFLLEPEELRELIVTLRNFSSSHLWKMFLFQIGKEILDKILIEIENLSPRLVPQFFCEYLHRFLKNRLLKRDQITQLENDLMDRIQIEFNQAIWEYHLENDLNSIQVETHADDELAVTSDLHWLAPLYSLGGGVARFIPHKEVLTDLLLQKENERENTIRLLIRRELLYFKSLLSGDSFDLADEKVSAEKDLIPLIEFGQRVAKRIRSRMGIRTNPRTWIETESLESGRVVQEKIFLKEGKLLETLTIPVSSDYKPVVQILQSFFVNPTPNLIPFLVQNGLPDPSQSGRLINSEFRLQILLKGDRWVSLSLNKELTQLVLEICGKDYSDRSQLKHAGRILIDILWSMSEQQLALAENERRGISLDQFRNQLIERYRLSKIVPPIPIWGEIRRIAEKQGFSLTLLHEIFEYDGTAKHPLLIYDPDFPSHPVNFIAFKNRITGHKRGNDISAGIVLPQDEFSRAETWEDEESRVTEQLQEALVRRALHLGLFRIPLDGEVGRLELESNHVVRAENIKKIQDTFFDELSDLRTKGEFLIKIVDPSNIHQTIARNSVELVGMILEQLGLLEPERNSIVIQGINEKAKLIASKAIETQFHVLGMSTSEGIYSRREKKKKNFSQDDSNSLEKGDVPFYPNHGKDRILSSDAHVLILADRPGVILEKNGKLVDQFGQEIDLKARVIVEAVEGAISSKAMELLSRMKKIVLPSILVLSGAIQQEQRHKLSIEKEDFRDVFVRILKEAKKYKVVSQIPAHLFREFILLSALKGLLISRIPDDRFYIEQAMDPQRSLQEKEVPTNFNQWIDLLIDTNHEKGLIHILKVMDLDENGTYVDYRLTLARVLDLIWELGYLTRVIDFGPLQIVHQKHPVSPTQLVSDLKDLEELYKETIGRIKSNLPQDPPQPFNLLDQGKAFLGWSAVTLISASLHNLQLVQGVFLLGSILYGLRLGIGLTSISFSGLIHALNIPRIRNRKLEENLNLYFEKIVPSKTVKVQFEDLDPLTFGTTSGDVITIAPWQLEDIDLRKMGGFLKIPFSILQGIQEVLRFLNLSLNTLSQERMRIKGYSNFRILTNPLEPLIHIPWKLWFDPLLSQWRSLVHFLQSFPIQFDILVPRVNDSLEKIFTPFIPILRDYFPEKPKQEVGDTIQTIARFLKEPIPNMVTSKMKTLLSVLGQKVGRSPTRIIVSSFELPFAIQDVKTILNRQNQDIQLIVVTDEKMRPSLMVQGQLQSLGLESTQFEVISQNLKNGKFSLDQLIQEKELLPYSLILLSSRKNPLWSLNGSSGSIKNFIQLILNIEDSDLHHLIHDILSSDEKSIPPLLRSKQLTNLNRILDSQISSRNETLLYDIQQ